MRSDLFKYENKSINRNPRETKIFENSNIFSETFNIFSARFNKYNLSYNLCLFNVKNLNNTCENGSREVRTIFNCNYKCGLYLKLEITKNLDLRYYTCLI